MPERTDWSASTIGERVKHAAKLRGWSLNKLGAESGMKGGPISRLSRRTQAVAGSPGTLMAIAKACRVELRWLMTGAGPVEALGERTVEKADRYPNRATAARFALEGGVSRAAIDDVLADELDSATDHPVLWWVDRMRDREHMLRTRQPPGRAPSAEEGAPPPRTARR